MEIIKTPIEGVFEIYPRIHSDSRGFFLEVFRDDILKQFGLQNDWKQENQSFSVKGTVRGLHYQKAPAGQVKLARVIMGKVLDVCVDLRKNSPTFGMHHAVILDGSRHNMLYVPEGCAHGLSALEDAIFIYKCSNYYHKSSEGGVIYNDPELNIDWKVDHPLLSEKDLALPSLKQFVQDSQGGL